MTSYTIDRPGRRPGNFAHLRPGEATIGQPVTVRQTDAEGNATEEFPAVAWRGDHDTLRVRLEDGSFERFSWREVFPRKEPYRRWIVAFRVKGRPVYELHPVPVTGRTDLEARAMGMRQIADQFGENAFSRYIFHSVKREG